MFRKFRIVKMMSAKLIHENTDLKKQTGCMNGIFQLFDRHRFIAKRFHGHSQNRPLSVDECGNQAEESRSKFQKAMQKDTNKIVKEKPTSTESSRTSFSSSSSCSSSFSSADYAISVPVEQYLSSQIIPDLPTKRQSSTTQSSQQWFDFGDVIRNAMHREVRGIAVKTTARDEAVVHTLKYIDSPRPSQLPKYHNESFQTPRSRNEQRDSCMHCSPKEIRRLSYDESDTLKSKLNLKELPRLSLDSKAGSFRSYISETNSKSYEQIIDLQQEPESSKRSSSVIAKLMGIEAFPDPTSSSECQSRFNNTCQTDRHDLQSKSIRVAKKDKKDSFSGSRRNAGKDLESSQKCPIEAGPWKQMQGQRGSETLGSKYEEVPARASNSSTSVYGEIEKRLAELEFKKSGKHLRALKQILEALQKTKGMSDSIKDQTSSFESQMSNNNGLDCNPPRTYTSQIIFMKPAKLNGKNTDPASAVSSFDNSTSPCKLRPSDSTFNKKELVEKRTAKHATRNNVSTTHCQSSSTDKNSHKRSSKFVQTSKTPRNNSGNSCGSVKSLGTASSNLQQKHFRLDNNQSHQISSSSYSSRSRRNRSKQPIESSSPGRKCMSGSPNLQRSKDQMIKTKTSISLDSYPDKETTFVIQSQEIKCTNFEQDSENQRDAAAGLGGAEPGNASGEQPSPMSVLEATFYREDSPSPVKKLSIDFEDEETLYPDEEKWRSMELAQLSRRDSCFSSEIDIKTLKDIKNLVQNTQLESFSRPDHIYISDILSASALLGYQDSSLTNIQFQNLDYVINPKMFFTLEQLKVCTKSLHDENVSEKNLEMKYNQVVHRKLVFDVVNEILSQKLVAHYSFNQCLVPKPRGQHLLGELCSEVDRLQDHDYRSLADEDDNMRSIIPEDLMDWSECESEIPQMVLDIERLIFKDLITEVINSDNRHKNHVNYSPYI